MVGRQPAWRFVEHACALAVIFQAGVWLFFYPFMPLARDQGIFAWMGQSVLNGLLPYRDAWEHKGPLVHVLYAIPQLFAHSSIAIRLFDMVLIAVGIFASSRALVHLGLSRLRWLCAAMIFMQYTSFWSSAQPDGWVGLGIAVVIAALFRDAGWLEWRAAAIIGVVVGLSVWVKPVYAVYALLPLFYAGIWRKSLKVSLRFAIRTWVIMALTAVPFFAWFASSGGLPDLWDAYVVFNLKNHSSIETRPMVSALSTSLLLAGLWPLILSIMALMSLPFFLRQFRKEGLVLLATCLLGYVAGVLQGKFFSYQFFPAFSPLFIAGMVGISMLPVAASRVTGRLDRWARLMKLVFAPLTILFIAFSTWVETAGVIRTGLAVAIGYESPLVWRKLFKSGDYDYAEIREVADYIAGNSATSDKMLVIGIDAGLYFEAGRMPPTRFGFQNGIVSSRGELRERYHRQIVSEVTRAPPLFIVLADNADNALYKGDAAFFLSRYPAEIGGLVASSYREAIRNRHFIVLQYSGQRNG